MGSGFCPTSKGGRRNASCYACQPSGVDFSRVPPLFPLPLVSVQYRHTRSTLRDNRFCGHRWDNSPICVSAAKTARFVRDFTVTREHYTVTQNHKYRHPYFYRHPPQTKVNRRFLSFGCRYGQQFLPTACFRFYCHPIHHKRVQVFVSHDFCAY